METTFKTEENHQVHVEPWTTEGGVWFRLSHQYASMHTILTNEEAQKLIDGLRKALGQCPKCGGEEWSAVTWSSSQGVTPYKDHAECSCGHSWEIEE